MPMAPVCCFGSRRSADRSNGSEGAGVADEYPVHGWPRLAVDTIAYNNAARPLSVSLREAEWWTGFLMRVLQEGGLCRPSQLLS